MLGAWPIRSISQRSAVLTLPAACSASALASGRGDAPAGSDGVAGASFDSGWGVGDAAASAIPTTLYEMGTDGSIDRLEPRGGSVHSGDGADGG